MFQICLRAGFCSFQLLKIGEHQLVLQHVTLQSSGVYSCQITLSGPPFDTVNKEKTLSVYGKLTSRIIKNRIFVTCITKMLTINAVAAKFFNIVLENSKIQNNEKTMNIFIEWDCFLVCGQNTFLTFFRIFIHELFSKYWTVTTEAEEEMGTNRKQRKRLSMCPFFLVVMKN